MNIKFRNIFISMKPFGTLTFNLLQLISAIIGIITTSICMSFIAWLLQFQNWMLPAATFLLGAILTLAFITFFRQEPSIRWRGYIHTKSEYTYQLHESNQKHHTLTAKTDIKAIDERVSLFIDTYRWTGEGKDEGPRVVSPGHSSLGKKAKYKGQNYYYVDLEHELKPGEKATIKTIQEFYDIEDKFETFFSRTIVLPTDYLVLHVILPKTPSLARIIFNEWDTDGPWGRLFGKARAQTNTQNAEIKKIQGKIDIQKVNIQENEISWQIIKPKIGHNYEIRWQYNVTDTHSNLTSILTS
ncbi:MAG: hypothetical protein H0U76_08125 [Ktedonobacteraceae bacterium]|nr:hypothetical protein [Ktedonobacteraceae bacterium]